MKIKLVSAALLALLACSCTEEFNDKNGVDGTNTMQVNAYIGKSPVTRAEKTAWENNDQLGVYVVDNSIDVPYKGSASYSNIPFVFTGKGFKSDNILLDENEGTVYAYYPYKSDLADPKAVPVDISEQTDHLYGEGNSKVSITARNVDIEMQHALTQVVFKIRKTSDYKGGEGKITAVVLKNTGAAKPLQIKLQHCYWGGDNHPGWRCQFLGQPDIDGGLCFPFQHSFSGKRHFRKRHAGCLHD